MSFERDRSVSLSEGTVGDFDTGAGFGHVVERASGARHFFHCTEIADGSRTIAVDSPVTFTVGAGRMGRWEAFDVAPNTFRCPVCGTRNDGAPRSWEICAHCGWEDDPVQFDDPAYAGGANSPSLYAARAALQERGQT